MNSSKVLFPLNQDTISLITAASFPATATHYLAKDAHIGISTQDIADYIQSLGDAGVSIVPDLYAVHKASSTSVYNPAKDPVVNSVWTAIDLSKYKVISTSYMVGWIPKPDTYSRNWIIGEESRMWIQSSYLCFNTFVQTSYDPNRWVIRMYPITATTLPVESDIPPFDSFLDLGAFDTALKNLASTKPEQIAKAIHDSSDTRKNPVAANPPVAVPTTADAPSITASEVQKALDANVEAVQKVAQTAIEAIDTANQTDAQVAQQIAAIQNAVDMAKTQSTNNTPAEETASEEPEEETFNPIAENGFSEPYNPGDHDISARFTSFLDNVKSSGLFSFSSSFFNSLPGGGSPVYEIEAGQYGHHTIDLSQTLSTGLAVLKTILLACFGFLSIRAVIMKR